MCCVLVILAVLWLTCACRIVVGYCAVQKIKRFCSKILIHVSEFNAFGQRIREKATPVALTNLSM